MCDSHTKIPAGKEKRLQKGSALDVVGVGKKALLSLLAQVLKQETQLGEKGDKTALKVKTTEELARLFQFESSLLLKKNTPSTREALVDGLLQGFSGMVKRALGEDFSPELLPDFLK